MPRSEGVFPQAWDKRIEPASSIPEHVHDVVALSLTLSGRYVEEFENETQTCGAFGLQLKPHGVPHATFTREGARIFTLGVSAAGLGRTALGALERPMLWTPGAASAIALGCHRELEAGRGDRSRANTLLKALLERLERQASCPVASAPRWILEVERRLRAELAAPPALEELARGVDVHPVHLARVFRRTFGVSAGEWVHGARADLAASALMETDEPVATLALRLGYYDQSHFGRHFRRETGWTPWRLRRAARALKG